MSFKPTRTSDMGRIHSDFSPPSSFIAAAVDLAMVPATAGRFAAQGPALGKSEMVGVRGASTANQARLPRDEFNMFRSRSRRGSGIASTFLLIAEDRRRLF
jgi:hypothetical protein